MRKLDTIDVRAEKECITDYITELNKIFDFAYICKCKSGYTLVVNGRAVIKIDKWENLYSKVGAFLQGAFFAMENELIDL